MIETERLRLRPYRSDDFEAFHALTVTMSHVVPDAAASRENSFRRFLANLGCWSLFGHGTFAVEERDGGAFVGNCGLFRMQRDLAAVFDIHPEAGWAIVPARRGRGYAGEAMAAALDWFDRIFGHRRTVCMIVSGNTPSVRLATKLGYVLTGQTEHQGDPVELYARDPRPARGEDGLDKPRRVLI